MGIIPIILFLVVVAIFIGLLVAVDMKDKANAP
jgi:hypothetical protein